MKQTSRALRAWRLLRLGLHILRGVLTAFLVMSWGSSKLRRAMTREWSRSLLALLGVRLEVRGKPPDAASRNVLLVSNHVSWLDIYLLNTVRPLRFVSKAEVRTWPVVGWLAVFTGTLFLERGKRRDTARVNDAVTAALANGDCVAFFPEGTTTDGTHIKPFLSSLLQAAINAQATLQPVALRYLLPDGGIDKAAAYYGDMSMMDSLRNVLARKEIRAELIFLDPIATNGHSKRAAPNKKNHPDRFPHPSPPPLAGEGDEGSLRELHTNGKHRRELAKQAEAAISSVLHPAGPRTKPGTAGDPPAVAR